MTDRFETTGPVNRSVLQELKFALMPQKQKIFLLVCGLIFAGILVFFAVMGVFETAIIFAAGTLVIVCEYFLLAGRYVKVNLMRIRENTGAAECRYTISFESNGVRVANHGTNADAVISYEHLTRLAETRNFYALMTQANQVVVVYKNQLDGERRAEFLRFLRQKCGNLKVKLKNKI